MLNIEEIDQKKQTKTVPNSLSLRYNPFFYIELKLPRSETMNGNINLRGFVLPAFGGKPRRFK